MTVVESIQRSLQAFVCSCTVKLISFRRMWPMFFVCFSPLQYWFQNRRAKSRREEEKMTARYQSSFSVQFRLPVRRGVLSERYQNLAQSYPEQWKHAECLRTSYPHSRPIRTDSHYSSIKSNQLRGHSSLPVPMFHPGHFKRGPVEIIQRQWT